MGTLREELPKKSLDIAISCLGFLLALLINSSIGRSNDHDAYLSMLKSIKSEGQSNQMILTESYGDLYHQGGIVLRDMSTSAAEQCLSNPIFAKEASPYNLELLNRYIRNAHLTNGYRRVYETLKLGPPGRADTEFESRLKQVWDKSLGDNQTDIAGVVTINR